MSGLSTICPYTGLRSFTEEESLYFKGRDLQVDQLTSLLEQNKFLMVTGASGEGKSSLIYAGLIPNARAGFFKAKYSNWLVADFRPERSPLHNMAQALSKTFDRNTASIETELHRGFSSLIDLYTNSDYHIEETEAGWLSLPEQQKQERKRKAANLLIIADQFEEFFTNPENFYRDAPSQDSQVVVNLLLETARIAIKRNIPVYIVCTMRSDYIGQCSAFRGLPEYIGFSQFFVPRLKRKDLKQVIEEPAILSGNRISQRLIERLVYDIAEGVDQLPILQHALSQVWLAAKKGTEEMDLIHYAMVGGMPVQELPDELQPKFRSWFEALPQTRQKYYEETGLHKVIEIHANVLYEKAWQDFNSRFPDTALTKQEAKRIIALTFSCLTKIDNSRAVRNRMTLGEITGIINTPACTTQVVGEVLSIYREDSNSFIRPFKTADPATHKLSPETVLDITHESLIRNWNKLNQWASQEFEFYSTYLDLKKQLDRWKQSGKSRGFLLPIGPLSYFENWYQQCKPNTGWIRRYAEIQEDPQQATADAEVELGSVKEFIKRSARKVAVTRAFMKYGAKRIAIVVAVAAILGLSAYYLYDAARKQNGRVVKKIRAELVSLMRSKEVGWDIKTMPLLMMERHEKGSMQDFLNGLETKERLKLARETCRYLLLFNKKDSSGQLTDLLRVTDNAFREMFSGKKEQAFLLTELNKFTSLLAFYRYYNPSTATDQKLRDFSDKGYELVMEFFRDSSLFKTTIPTEINYAVQQWLTFGTADSAKTAGLLQQITPIDNDGGRAYFHKYYPKGRKEANGRVNNEYNGGFHLLASLYAFRGDSSKIRQCLDSIRLAGDNDYFTGIGFNGSTNLLAILYQSGHADKAGSLLTWLHSHYKDLTDLEIYKQAVNRSGFITEAWVASINNKNFGSLSGYFYPNLCLADRSVFNALADEYEKRINQVSNPSERNFLLAMQKKRRALFTDKYCFDRGLPADTAALNGMLQEATGYYRKTDAGFLDETVPVLLSYYNDGVRNYNLKRRHLFLYPGYMDGWYSGIYHTDLFFRYLDQQNLFGEFYKTAEDWGFIHQWLAYGTRQFPFGDQQALRNNYPVKDTILLRILSLRETNPSAKAIDPNLACLLLANRRFESGDNAGGMQYYRQFDRDNFSASRDKYEYLEQTFFLNQLNSLCVNLAGAGKIPEATGLAEKFEKPHEKIFAYIFMAERVYRAPSYAGAFVFLDSVFSKKRGIDSARITAAPNFNWEYRFNLVALLARIGGKNLNSEADKVVSELREQDRGQAIGTRARGIAMEGNFYRARASLPATYTEQEDLLGRVVILHQECLRKETETERRNWRAMDEMFTPTTTYIFYRPF